MRQRRSFFPIALPTWLVLVVGMMMGSVLTSTFTFRFWWCPYDGISVDRETLSIIQVNEHIRSPLNSRERCVCGLDLERLKEAIHASTGAMFVSGTQLNAQVPSIPKEISSGTDARNTYKALYNSSKAFSEYLVSPNITPSNLEADTLGEEYTKKQTLLVAVATTFKTVERAAAIYDTWALDVSQVLFYTTEEGNVTSYPMARGLPIIKLPGTRKLHSNTYMYCMGLSHTI